MLFSSPLINTMPLQHSARWAHRAWPPSTVDAGQLSVVVGMPRVAAGSVEVGAGWGAGAAAVGPGEGGGGAGGEAGWAGGRQGVAGRSEGVEVGARRGWLEVEGFGGGVGGGEGGQGHRGVAARVYQGGQAEVGEADGAVALH